MAAQRSHYRPGQAVFSLARNLLLNGSVTDRWLNGCMITADYSRKAKKVKKLLTTLTSYANVKNALLWQDMPKSFSLQA